MVLTLPPLVVPLTVLTCTIILLMVLMFLSPTPRLIVRTFPLSEVPISLPLTSNLLSLMALMSLLSMALIFLPPTLLLMVLTPPPQRVQTLLPLVALTLMAFITPLMGLICLPPTFTLVAPSLLSLMTMASLPSMALIFPLPPRHQAEQLPQLFQSLLL